MSSLDLYILTSKKFMSIKSRHLAERVLLDIYATNMPCNANY